MLYLTVQMCNVYFISSDCWLLRVFADNTLKHNTQTIGHTVSAAVNQYPKYDTALSKGFVRLEITHRLVMQKMRPHHRPQLLLMLPLYPHDLQVDGRDGAIRDANKAAGCYLTGWNMRWKVYGRGGVVCTWIDVSYINQRTLRSCVPYTHVCQTLAARRDAVVNWTAVTELLWLACSLRAVVPSSCCNLHGCRLADQQHSGVICSQ